LYLFTQRYSWNTAKVGVKHQSFNQSTISFMVYGGLCRQPLGDDIEIHMVSYWAKFMYGKQSKLSSILYKIMSFLSLS
jgi:hypothetical protein